MHKSFLITEKNKILGYFSQSYSKKLTSMNTIESQKNCKLIFILRHFMNILVKSVSFYIETNLVS